MIYEICESRNWIDDSQKVIFLQQSQGIEIAPINS